MTISLALYQPDIPQNTGTLLRLCACLDVAIHIIHPTGFTFSEKAFRRSAMDYAAQVQMHEHDSFEKFNEWRLQNLHRLILMSTKASTSYCQNQYLPGDILLAGRETAGVPKTVVNICDGAVCIPMRSEMRSLNVAVAGAMVLGEALRQTAGFS